MRGGAFFNGKEGRDDFRKTAPEGGYILPFSRRVSVPCEGNRKGRKAYCGLVWMWSSPCRRDGKIEKSALRGGFPLLPSYGTYKSIHQNLPA